MTDSESARLVGRALLDDEFRSKLLEDPQKAARSLRITLSPMEAAGIRRLDPKTLEQVSEQVQKLAGRGAEVQGITW
jgi:hypothetical protein